MCVWSVGRGKAVASRCCAVQLHVERCERLRTCTGTCSAVVSVNVNVIGETRRRGVHGGGAEAREKLRNTMSDVYIKVQHCYYYPCACPDARRSVRA